MPEAHAHGLDAEIIKEARQRVPLSHTMTEGEEPAVATINADTGAAVSENVTDHAEEIVRKTHGSCCA